MRFNDLPHLVAPGSIPWEDAWETSGIRFRRCSRDAGSRAPIPQTNFSPHIPRSGPSRVGLQLVPARHHRPVILAPAGALAHLPVGEPAPGAARAHQPDADGVHHSLRSTPAKAGVFHHSLPFQCHSIRSTPARILLPGPRTVPSTGLAVPSTRAAPISPGCVIRNSCFVFGRARLSRRRFSFSFLICIERNQSISKIWPMWSLFFV